MGDATKFEVAAFITTQRSAVGWGGVVHRFFYDDSLPVPALVANPFTCAKFEENDMSRALEVLQMRELRIPSAYNSRHPLHFSREIEELFGPTDESTVTSLAVGDPFCLQALARCEMVIQLLVERDPTHMKKDVRWVADTFARRIRAARLHLNLRLANALEVPWPIYRNPDAPAPSYLELLEPK